MSHRAEELLTSVNRYFDLMYDSDVSRFDEIFFPTFQMHGYVNEEMRGASAARYKEVMRSHPSPRSVGAPREEEVLLVNFASDTQALVKVRVRIDKAVYVDYLNFHSVAGKWWITAKSYHTEHAGH